MTAAFNTLPELSAFDWLGLDELRSPILQSGRDHWLAIRGQRRFPARRELTARALTQALPYMTLVKVIDGGADFEHRIVGDVHVRAFRIPLQKRRFSEIETEEPQLVSTSRPIFQKVVQTGAPLAFRGRIGRNADYVAFTDVESVFLPLGDSDAAVDHVAVFSFYGRNTWTTDKAKDGNTQVCLTSH